MASLKKITGKIKGVFKRETSAQKPVGDTNPTYGLPAHVTAFLAERPKAEQPPVQTARTGEELAAIAVLAGYGGNNAPPRASNLRLV